MEILTVACTVVLAIAVLGTGLPKVTLRGPTWTALRDRGLSPARVRFIGAAELAGSVGLVAGHFQWHIGVAAATGLLVLFASAVVFHVKYGDFGNPDASTPAWTAFILAHLAAVVIALLLLTN
ncbi:DoxX family protein [Rhodococcus sp. NPDC058514]|uniref:DoxX family protein n=1 Tax=unclassified Rhodococcus (in: high G+C Gram-positive bacteria) TaxID=192944 RepID=UPI00364C02C8